MSSFLRLVLLGLFGAAGVALAVCVATSEFLPGDPPQAPLTVIERGLGAEPSQEAPSDPPRAEDPLRVASATSAPSAEEGSGFDLHQVLDALETLGKKFPLVPLKEPTAGESPQPDAQQADTAQDSAGQIDAKQTSTVQTGTVQPGAAPPDAAQPSGEQPGEAAASGAVAPASASAPATAPEQTGATSSPPAPAATPSSAAAGTQAEAPAGAPPPPPAADSQPPETKTQIRRPGNEGDDHLSITIQGEDIRKVLELLSEQGGLNILASRSVQGSVSATLKGVDIETALDAILKSTGYVWRREGKFIYVGTPQDFASMKRALEQIGVRLYRPNYVQAAELQSLITPILTQGVGTTSITTPAGAGIAPDGNSAGGDGFAGQEALLVRDYEAVLAQIDEIFEQVDRRPTQVAIEAMILSVRLNDSNKIGVDFSLLRDQGTIHITSGSPVNDLAQIKVDDGGLKVGFLDSSLGMFLDALETIGDTNVIATPKLMCLNKHRAEILIGSQLGYVSTTQTETSTTQSVEFLEVGTQLRLRPFISSDGMIRMEVHPELSTGEVNIEGNFTLPNKQLTQVTTNIMVQDGSTVVIGGLLRDELVTSGTQIPLFGSMPLLGPLFRHRNEDLKREEIVVLITPRIVYEPGLSCEGEHMASEFHHRHMVVADSMLPYSRQALYRKYFRLAQQAWATGDRDEALRLVNLAIHFSPTARAAIDLRADIWAGNPVGDHTLPQVAMPAMPLEGSELPPWLLERFDDEINAPPHPRQPGQPGSRHDIP